MRNSLGVIMLALLLSACSQQGAVRIRDADIRLDDTHIRISDGNSGGSFCPPGQAKKGRC
ncbi:hypothetical protein LA374_04420 [Aeromonas schubertii]|uniref:Lipoprotein n=1 Tax=Aeromonas schubertii TaxID=652 RepID=A0ABS7V8Q7_9GAMM|nr:hypothetical protein [Aeromonas schubertii]MBZ6065460.1 hypothetical protein [Aeromonas schubertii]